MQKTWHRHDYSWSSGHTYFLFKTLWFSLKTSQMKRR
ncbi:unnamed protein product [Gongylonema pulchrum]|uniref:Uncharacterized protein n=1 Tax=Gongylonema pulchrum TaxID=637853 RepID=A0A183EVL4_9BILA|nr:unnamed protein product [Gongylonema pulchrum]